MRLFRLTLIAFWLGAASLCVAQEPKPSPQTSSGDSAAKSSEETKGEVDLALEELKKRGEMVLGACLEKCKDSPITSGVITGKGIELIQPPYPGIARAARASGAVPVLLLIDKEGHVSAAQVLSGHPLLWAAALKAAKASRFTPTLLDGKPVHVWGKIIYHFVAQ